MTTTLDKFLRYVRMDTRSEDESVTTPSTMKQHDLAGLLVREMEDMGMTEITYDREHCYVYGTIPASVGLEKRKVMGLIAHMDTSPAVSGANVKSRIVTRYDGGDILLNEDEKIVLKVEDFPELKGYLGDDLVVTDGTTLLGADDKAGIAEIMGMAEYLLSHPEVRHGKIRIAFTPDEEIGRGADFFDISLFGADFAYTVDGGALGELEYENFNAAGARVCIHGRSVHPGSAKGKMRNAILIAQEFQSMLPVEQNPMYTEGYEGFFHVDRIAGDVEETTMDYIIRDHDRILFEHKKELLLQVQEFLNAKYGEGCVEVKLQDSYYNMREIMESNMHLIERVKCVMKEMGIEPKVTPIRGGTDGARLSFLGLPCPNLCAGGENFHGKYEYVSVQSMEKITGLLIRIAEEYEEEI